MDETLLIQIAIIGTFGLLGLGILSAVVAGIKSLAQGKQEVKKIGIMSIPIIIFAVSYFTLGEYVKAGVMTTLVMMATMAVTIAFTGIRGTFKS